MPGPRVHRPAQITDKTDETPSGRCGVHHRFLVSREIAAGCCGWCEPDRFEWSPKDRAAIDRMNAPRVWPEFVTCATCPAPLPPGNRYHCEPCVAAIQANPPQSRRLTHCAGCRVTLAPDRHALCAECFRRGTVPT